MKLKNRLIDFLYRITTGSKKFRNLLTPAGAIFYIIFTSLFVFVSLQIDKILDYPRLISEPANIILALQIVIFGASISIWSVIHFIKSKGTPVPINPPPKLVSGGPFFYARNPMVTGIFIVLFGLGLLFNSLTLIFVFTPIFIFINTWEFKNIEEPELERRLGEEYIKYKSNTPMFIPILKKFN